MRKRLLLTTLGVGVVAVASVVPASAMATREIKARIPFSFEVENTVLPAGDYTIAPLGIDDPSVLVLHSADNKTAIQFLTVATTPEKKLQSAELVFDRLGKKEFLREVLVPGDASSSSIPRGGGGGAGAGLRRRGVLARRSFGPPLPPLARGALLQWRRS